MPLYEHVYLVRPDLSAQQVDELTSQYKGVIEQLGGSVQKVEYWGVKSLTYRIRKNRKAHFTLLNLDAPPAALAELERQERINEDVLRALSVRVEALEAGPSAMMRKSDRDDRRDDRRGDDRRRDREGRGPREGGPREGGPREGGPREVGPREGGPREGRPREDRAAADDAGTAGEQSS